MKRLKCGVLALAITSAVFLTPATNVYAHGHHGGGHHSGTSYYYCGGHSAHTHTNGICPYAGTSTSATYHHCGGYSAHLHTNGVCPYGSVASSSKVKKVQKKLNKSGYNCGTADGIVGTKTVKALKKFQKACGLTADGIIGNSTLRALGISV